MGDGDRSERGLPGECEVLAVSGWWQLLPITFVVRGAT